MAHPIPWEEGLEWLRSTGVFSPQDKVSQPEASLVDLARQLQDGTRLCDLLNKMKPGTIKVIHRNTTRQFLCLQNINHFLAAAKDVFLVREEELFDPNELFHSSQFDKILITLSVLSKHPSARTHNWSPFPKGYKSAVVVESEYDNLENLVAQQALEKQRTLRRSLRMSTMKRRQQRATRTAVEDSDSDSDNDQQETYSNIFEFIKADVYGEICGSSKPKSKPNASGHEKYRHISQELLETETNYLAGLKLIRDAFMIPLQLERTKLGMSKEDLEMIFLNLVELCDVHEKLLAGLQGTKDLGKIFSSMRRELLCYLRYCPKLPKATEKLDGLVGKREVAQSLKQMQDRSKQRFELKDLLSIPMQRLLKYPLLLKDLAKYSPHGEQHEHLVISLGQLEDLAKHVNDSQRDYEAIQTSEQIEASLKDYDGKTSLTEFGRYILDGDVRMKNEFDGKIVKRYVFLFQKALIVCKQKFFSYHFSHIMNTRDFSVEEEWIKNRNVGIKMKSRLPSAISFNCTLILKTELMCEKWKKAISQAKTDIVAETAVNSSNTRTHQYVLHTFPIDSTCDCCGQYLWGLINQGFRCQSCQLKAHKGCMSKLDASCGSAQHVREGIQKGKLSTPGIVPSATIRIKAPRLSADVRRNTANPRMAAKSQTLNPRANKPKKTVIAVHNYDTHADRREGDLAFRKGDIITVIDQISPHWYRGRSSNGMEGMVPKSFVKEHNATETHYDVTAVNQPTERTQRAHTVHARPGQVRPAPAGNLRNKPPPKLPESSDDDSHDYENVDSDGEIRAPPRPKKSQEFLTLEMKQPPRPAKPVKKLSGNWGSDDDDIHDYENVEEDPPPLPCKRSLHGNEEIPNKDISIPRSSKPASKWFVGKMAREQADMILVGLSNGNFFVRESTSRPGEYTLSVKCNVVRHIKISQEHDNFMLTKKKPFCSVPELVDYYQVVPLTSHFRDIATTLEKAAGSKDFPKDRNGSRPIVTALFSFQGQDDDELTLKAGDTIIVIAKDGCGSGWWRGMANGHIGVFPASYVEESTA